MGWSRGYHYRERGVGTSFKMALYGVSSSSGSPQVEVSYLVECSSHYVGYSLVAHNGEASGWGYCSGGVVLLRGC